MLFAPVQVKVILFSAGETLGELINGVAGYPLLIEHEIEFNLTPSNEFDKAVPNDELSNVVFTVSRLPEAVNKSGMTT